MRAIACAAVVAIAVIGLSAQESGSGGSPSADIGRIDVSAEAYSPSALAPAESLSVVTAEDIARMGAINAADALAAAPGVWVNRGGPQGSAASASIGGSSGNQVLVIVDGVRFNDSRQGGADLAQIPAESIERIEVLRGGASAAYGADALGGVIVVTTKKSGTRRLSVRVENTAYPAASAENCVKSLIDGQSLGLEAGGRLGLADLALSAQAERATNGYGYSSDGSALVRDHASFWMGSANLSVGAPIAEGRLSVLASGSYQDAQVPGSLSYPSPQAEEKDSTLRGSLGWSSDALAGGSLVLDVRGHGGFSRLDIVDPSNPGLFDMTNGGIDLRATYSLSPSIDLGFGSSLLYEAADATSFDSRPEGQPTRLSLGAYAEPEFRFGDRLSITPALRYDWNDNYVAGVSAMLGAVWKASDAIDLRLSGGRSYRAPTFNDLYWPFTDYGWGFSYRGNPDLKPETAWSGELGLDLRHGAFSLAASGSARLVSNLIKITSDASSTMVNLDSTFIPDASIEAAYRTGLATLKANYEFLYPLDISGGRTLAEGDLLENFSRHKAGASADFAFGPIAAGLAASYWSDRVVTDYVGAHRVRGAAIVDLTAVCQVRKGLRLNVAVNNLFDSDYQVNYDYPMPGISVKVGAKLDL